MSDISRVLPVLILLFSLLALLIITHRGKPRLNKSHFDKKWDRIQTSTDYRASVRDADALLDDALKRVGIKGGTTGERLNNAVGFLTDINNTWSAHKLRNQIVSDDSFVPTDTEHKRALRNYKKALKDLGAL